MPHRGTLWTALIFVLVIHLSAGMAGAANDVWDNNPGGNWGNGANWVDGSTPAINDTATFNLAQTYTVTFADEPGVIQALLVSAGSVTFQSSGGAKTLHLTAGAGSQDIVVSNASTTLTLGSLNNSLHLNAGDDLSIRTGAVLEVLFGSRVTAFDLSDGGLNGTLRVDGAGSMLTLSGAISNLVGTSGNGLLILQNGSMGNAVNGSLGLANSTTAGVIGELSILGGSTLTLGGNLTLANQNVTGQVGWISIQGASTMLTQSGGATTTVGSAANGTASIAIGTSSGGATFSTGTGLFTINKTGTVTIGGGANPGTMIVGDDVTINGGVLQRANASSNFDLAAGRTVTIQNGGRLSFVGPSVAESNQIYNVSGANTRLEITDISPFSIADGAQVNLTNGAAFSAGGRIDVARGGGSGTLTADGGATTVTAGGPISVWGDDGGPVVRSVGLEQPRRNLRVDQPPAARRPHLEHVAALHQRCPECRRRAGRRLQRQRRGGRGGLYRVAELARPNGTGAGRRR